MSVFLTGSESFIGRVVAQRCQELAIDVSGVDSNAPDNAISKRADIRDPEIADLIPE